MSEASPSIPALLPLAAKLLQPKLTPFSALRRPSMCEISISTTFSISHSIFFSDFVIRFIYSNFFFLNAYIDFFPCIWQCLYVVWDPLILTAWVKFFALTFFLILSSAPLCSFYVAFASFHGCFHQLEYIFATQNDAPKPPKYVAT